MIYIHTIEFLNFLTREGGKNLWGGNVFGNNIFLLLLCDSDGFALPTTKVMNSDGGKLEIMTTDCSDNNMW
jgi:hypothetical protein